ncbi:hypothetical protein IFM89_005253, partial [Coptis chinensis]
KQGGTPAGSSRAGVIELSDDDEEVWKKKKGGGGRGKRGFDNGKKFGRLNGKVIPSSSSEDVYVIKDDEFPYVVGGDSNDESEEMEEDNDDSNDEEYRACSDDRDDDEEDVERYVVDSDEGTIWSRIGRKNVQGRKKGFREAYKERKAFKNNDWFSKGGENDREKDYDDAAGFRRRCFRRGKIFVVEIEYTDLSCAGDNVDIEEGSSGDNVDIDAVGDKLDSDKVGGCDDADIGEGIHSDHVAVDNGGDIDIDNDHGEIGVTKEVHLGMSRKRRNLGTSSDKVTLRSSSKSWFRNDGEQGKRHERGPELKKRCLEKVKSADGNHQNEESVLPNGGINKLIISSTLELKRPSLWRKQKKKNTLKCSGLNMILLLPLHPVTLAPLKLLLQILPMKLTSFHDLLQVDTEDADESSVELDPSTTCCYGKQGKHDLVIDDEVGIKCRFCSFVHLEMKYVLPPLETQHYERLLKKNSADERDLSMWEDLHFDDASGDSQVSSDPGKGTVWNIFPRIRESMYHHQQEGFEFLWKNIAGGLNIENLRNSPPPDHIGGCVISHAPGTGKTFLTIAFLRSYMEIFKESRAVIMVPASMLLTWEEEFKKWKIDIPFHNLNSWDFTGREDRMAHKLIQGKNRNNKWTRLVKLLSWSKEKSVLGISYNLFEKHAGDRFVNGRNKEKVEMRRILLEKPGLLVFDEGHTPRNKHSLIWKALGNVKTDKRIILSGTPFQNNFDELYNTLCLVRPKFAEKFFPKTPNIRQAKSDLRSQDARRLWASLTNSIGKDDDQSLLDPLRSLIDPFVHVHRGSILKENLPGLRDRVIVLVPTPLQRELLEELGKIQNPLELEHSVSLASVHPSLFLDCRCSKSENPFMDKVSSAELRLEPAQGAKTRFLMELIRLCEVLKEKVLVFSQFKAPFCIIKDQLNHHFNWTEGEEVLKMDGNLDMKSRQSLINLFNDPCSKAKVLLASTKTCREGISLIGASRVVLLDVVWNPSVERQAISRAYRLGQKKVVYTYRLLTSGTMEESKYDRQEDCWCTYELVFEFACSTASLLEKLTQLQQMNPEQTKRKCSQKKTCDSVITAQFELRPPPYPLNSLEPHMSSETLEYHWGKHHRAYVENLNRQVVGTELDGMTLEDIILLTYNRGDPLPAFNNAAQKDLNRKMLKHSL